MIYSNVFSGDIQQWGGRSNFLSKTATGISYLHQRYFIIEKKSRKEEKAETDFFILRQSTGYRPFALRSRSLPQAVASGLHGGAVICGI